MRGSQLGCAIEPHEALPPQDRKAWVDDLISRQSHPGTVIVMVAAMVSSAGCFDALCVGGSGATLTQWVDSTHRTFTASWCLGTEVTQHDVDCFSLAKAAEWTSRQFFNHQWPQPSHVYFLCGSLAAFASMSDPQGLANQRECLLFHSSLTSPINRHPAVQFTMVWSPAVPDQSTDSTAQFKALVPPLTRSSWLLTVRPLPVNVPSPAGPPSGPSQLIPPLPLLCPQVRCRETPQW